MSNKYRIGTEIGGNTGDDLLINTFVKYRIETPTLPEYRPYEQLLARADFLQSRRGIASARLFWDDMPFHHLEFFRQKINAGRQAGILYLTMDIQSVEYPRGQWADISGQPQELKFSRVEDSEGVVFADVLIEVLNVQILNLEALNI